MHPSPAEPKEHGEHATVLVSGDAAVLAKVHPLLEVIGGSIHHTAYRPGPASQGGEPGACGQQLRRGG